MFPSGLQPRDVRSCSPLNFTNKPLNQDTGTADHILYLGRFPFYDLFLHFSFVLSTSSNFPLPSPSSPLIISLDLLFLSSNDQLSTTCLFPPFLHGLVWVFSVLIYPSCYFLSRPFLSRYFLHPLFALFSLVQRLHNPLCPSVCNTCFAFFGVYGLFLHHCSCPSA